MQAEEQSGGFSASRPTLREIVEARERIAAIARRTPLIRSTALSERAGTAVWLKLESLQETGSFKVRGAANRMLQLTDEERGRGVITVSTGNHGRAVAYVAGRLGIPAVICTSERVPASKLQAIRGLGAEVVVHGASYDEAEQHSLRLAKKRGLVPIWGFDDPLVIAGQGTIGLELLEDLPDIDTAVVPLAGGGLISGIALALASSGRKVRLIGVSQDRAPVMVESLRAGRPIELPEEETLADALAGGIGLDNRYTFPLVRELVDATILVTEPEIAAAIVFAFEEHRLVVEGGGAVALAALMHGRGRQLGRAAAVIISGGNIDLPLLHALSRGLAVRDQGERPTDGAGSVHDIPGTKRTQEELGHDALTQLPNRALFLDHLGLSVNGVRRRKDSMAGVVLLGLDRFKSINEELGNRAGDEVLVELARRLRHFLRPGDTVARLGGDEFAVLLNDVHGVGDATRIAERIQELIREKMAIGGCEVFTSASIGVALSSPGDKRPEEILRDADAAMHRAKAAERGSYRLFDQDMHRSAVALLKLETELRRAVELKQFVMHYQPIVSLESGRIVGFEGLVRWKHPERGLVNPERFIAVADETGLIVPLGWWVLRQACRHAREWQQLLPLQPPPYVSVNVSGKVVVQPDMFDRVTAILEETGLPATSLRLEVAENLIMDHGEIALGKLVQLHDLGVRFSVDNFGTGYSSLSYLRRFSYDTLKIDRSLISGMDSEGDASTIVPTIVALANVLKIDVVAEGVETSMQLKRLREIGCSHGQGYWFSKPVDRAATQALLLHPPVW